MAARKEEGEVKNGSHETVRHINVIKVGRRIVFSYPLVAQSDMPQKMKLECQELCSSVMEKHSDNYLVSIIDGS